MIASLDHAMWFHRPFRADDWLLYHQTSPSAQARAGSPRGSSSATTATLAITVIQEGLIRPVERAERVEPEPVPSPDGRVDLRSDTVTTPTPEMRRAMADGRSRRRRVRRGPDGQPASRSARPRCSGRKRRSTCRRGRWRTSSRCGCSAGPGPKCCAARGAHVYRYEARRRGVELPGCSCTRSRTTTARSTADELEPAVAEQRVPPARGLADRAREHAHAGAAAGRGASPRSAPSPPVARARELPLLRRRRAHLERVGRARCAAPRSSSRERDTAMFCLSKGLGAPVGSVLCGPADVDRRGPRPPPAARRRHAPGRGDRRGRASSRSRRWSSASPTTTARAAGSPRRSPSAGPGTRRSRRRCETNIVLRPRRRAPGRRPRAPRRPTGIRAGTIDPGTVRFVTHKDVDDADLERVLKALSAIA